MGKADKYDFNLNFSVKIYPAGFSGVFKISDIMVSGGVAGEYPGDINKNDVSDDLKPYLNKLVEAAILEIPLMVDHGVAKLQLALPQENNNTISGNVSLAINRNETKEEKKDQTPSVNQNPDSSITFPQENQKRNDSSNTTVPDPALEQVRKVFAKIMKVPPYDNLTLNDPIDDYTKSVNISKWLDSDRKEKLVVSYWKDIKILIGYLRRMAKQSTQEIITFDEWKLIMEYFVTRNWVVKTSENHYDSLQ
ncbi:MAG: hypothetical protein QXP38_02405 [Nitrososphaerota archaeon]